MNPDVTLYDTTLRDGAQAEGINFSTADKLRIAAKLDAFGIHYIEGGWPGSNPKDIEFFEKAKALALKHARIAAFGSTRRAGIRVEDDAQVRTLLEAATPVVTIYGKTSLFQVREVLKTTAEENLAMIEDTVRFLKANGREVVYDAEHCFDGLKEDRAYALDCLRAARRGGADSIALCDTNGGSLPGFVTEMTRLAVAEVGGPFGIHTHDDGGLGVANALAAVEAGVVQVQGTANGYGERNGNCNLTTVIANLQLKMGRHIVPDERLAQLRDLSLFVDETANQRPNIRAPFVGQASFAHKGGTHVNAVNKSASSYEHIRPEAVGNSRRILVGELSGRTNVMMKARELNLTLDEKAPETRQILDRIKQLESEGYEFEGADASFELLARKTLTHHAPFFELIEYHVSIRKQPAKESDVCEATVKVAVNGEEAYTVAEGDGPVNALDAALRAALVKFYPRIAPVTLTDYKVRIVNSASGTAAKVRVFIESTDSMQSWCTVGVSTNIIEASWIALADSIEYFLLRTQA
jgi:2-isopropylmalate synthase